MIYDRPARFQRALPPQSFFALIVCWLFVAATGFALAARAGIAGAAPPANVESIVVKLQTAAAPDGNIVDENIVLSGADRDALAAALQTSFSVVGQTRDGALRLDLQQPLPLVTARAAVNRVRLLPQVVYANIALAAREDAGDAANVAREALARHPPITRLIVKYRDAAKANASMQNEQLPATDTDRIAALAGQPVVHERAMSGGAYVVRLFRPLSADEAISLARYLEGDPEIEYVEPDLLVQPVLTPNDPNYTSQWHYMSPPAEMGGANLPLAWNVTTGSASVVAGVIDTGILPGHPDLAGRTVGGYDFVSDVLRANDGNGRDSDPSDPGDWVTAAEVAVGQPFQGCPTTNSTFHGSHVAGTIGAASNNGIGVAGINWVSKILPLRALGKCGGATSDIVDAIRWAVGLSVPGVPANQNPAWVLNLSFGGYACDLNGQNCSCGNTYQSAIDAAVSAGAVVVVAAGNSNRPALESRPANCNGVITVAATGRQGQKASYSSYGSVVEISAPGGSDGQAVLSTGNSSLTSPDSLFDTYITYQGTSMATPHVTGIVSLMLSRNPLLTPAQVMSILQTTARPFPTGTIRDCTTTLCGAGIVDAAAAVLAAGGSAFTTTEMTSSSNPAAGGTTVTFTATVTGTGATPTGNVGFTDGGNPIAGCTTVALAGPSNARTAACPAAGLALGAHTIVANYGGDPANLASTSAALIQNINAPSTASAAFLGTDVLTQGNWKGVYGSDGYAVFSDTTSYPSYAQVTPSGKSDYVWSAQPDADVRALQRGLTAGRIAACWYSGGVINIDVNLTDGNNHKVTLYLVDWDSFSRNVRVDVLDAGNQQVLATQTVGSFHNGVHVKFDLRGHVIVRLTNVGSSNVVMSGIFFDPLTATPTFALSGTVTAGGQPLAGVSFATTGALSCTASDGTGHYGCTVPQGGSGTVTPSLSGYTFVPASRSYNAVAADQAAQDYAATAVVTPPAPTTTVVASSSNPAAGGTTVTFTATVTGTGATPTGNVGFTDGGNPIAGCTTVALAGPSNARTAACPAAGLALGAHTIVANYGGDPANLASTSAALIQNINAPSTASAAFLGTDVLTQGNWKGVYGSDGYAVFSDTTSYPSYAQVTPSGKSDYVWSAQPDADVRALQRGLTAGRIAACWYSGGVINIDVNLTDGNNHKVTLYLVDWDSFSRNVRVDVLDAGNQQVLATQTVGSFHNGVHVKFDLRGHVIVRLTNVGSSNVVMSGIFFDPLTATPTFALSGTVTAGGQPLAGVSFATTGALSCTASDGTGHYGCTVPQGGSGTVTPSLSGYTFVPASRSYNAVAADQAAQDYAATAVVTPPAPTTTVVASSSNPAAGGTTVTFTATVTGTGATPTGNVGFTDGGNPIAGCTTVALAGPSNARTAACPAAGLALGAHTIVANYGGDPANLASTSAALIQNINAPSTASAAFLGTDVLTQGNWKGVYGSDGYAVFSDTTSYPSYAQVTPSGKSDYVWSAQPDADVRALQRGLTAGRIAACWYSGGVINIDVNLTDGNNHKVTLYLVDWDSFSRNVRVDVLDAGNQQVLATQTVGSFHNGVHVKFDLRGHVIVRLTNVGSSNAVISGLMFDPPTP